MSKQWSKEEKINVINFREKNTILETSIKFNISQATINRWVKEYKINPDNLEWGNGTQAKATSKKRFSKTFDEDGDFSKLSRRQLEEELKFYIAVKKHLTGTIKNRFFAAYELSTEFTVDFLSKKLHFSRQGYYLWLKNGKPKHKKYNLKTANLIQQLFKRFKGVYGYNMISLFMRKYFNVAINPWVVYRYMKILKISAKRRKVKPNYAKSGAMRFENLLSRDFTSYYLNEKWVTDITYIPIRNGMRYLSIVRDLYNGEIIDWVLSNTPNENISIQNLWNAWIKTEKPRNVIIHSDQGATYTSNAWKMYCEKWGFKISMSRRGNSPDNGACEAWFSSFKLECLYTYKRVDLTDENLFNLINDYVDFYNYVRPIRNKLNTPYELRMGY